MNVLGMEEWRKVRRNNKWKVARPNDKLAVGARVVFNKKKVGQDREVEKHRCRLTASRVLAGRRGALLTHSKESVNPDTFGNGGSGRRRRAAPL